MGRKEMALLSAAALKNLNHRKLRPEKRRFFAPLSLKKVALLLYILPKI